MHRRLRSRPRSVRARVRYPGAVAGPILLVGHYQEPDPARRAELSECLRENARNAHLRELHVLIETEEDPAVLAATHEELRHPKVRLFPHGRRLTFRALFDHARRAAGGHTVIIANADVWCDDTLGLLEDLELAGRLLCLSRWEPGPDGPALFEHPFSQDAWVFHAPLPEFPSDFPLGVPACDNRLAYEAHAAGLSVENPSRSIRVHHLHGSNVRRYSERQRLQGPVRPVPATFLAAPAPQDRRRVVALTSLSPAPSAEATQRAAIASWRRAGCRVVSFNHPSEIAELAGRYDVELVAPATTSEAIFGRPYVPIHEMVRWASRHDVCALLINADIELLLDEPALRRLRWVADRGICYVIRWNHDGDLSRATREPYGIDAFLLHGRHGALVPESFLSMGQPFWDYWLPWLFARAGLPVHAVEEPVAFHRDHPRRWSDAGWHRCALEFDRMAGLLGPRPEDRDLSACTAMSAAVRHSFERLKLLITSGHLDIRSFVQQRFGDARPKVFLELGSHLGTDTAWMASLPNVVVHAFEPDPRNDQPPLPNVVRVRAAVAEHDGRAPLVLSREGWGREWTYSSSIRRPKNHLARYPVTFGDAVDVETVSLDGYCERNGITDIDFIWADIQGAEGDMIRGGMRTLSRTRYLYTEYSDHEMYEGQITLAMMLELLPGFRVVELYPDDVLLANEALTS